MTLATPTPARHWGRSSEEARGGVWPGLVKFSMRAICPRRGWRNGRGRRPERRYVVLVTRAIPTAARRWRRSSARARPGLWRGLPKSTARGVRTRLPLLSRSGKRAARRRFVRVTRAIPTRPRRWERSSAGARIGVRHGFGRSGMRSAVQAVHRLVRTAGCRVGASRRREWPRLRQRHRVLSRLPWGNGPSWISMWRSSGRS